MPGQAEAPCRSFGIRTAYATVVSSWLTVAFDKLTPLAAPMTSQPLLELLFAVALPAVGAAMLFDVNASSGGTDIIAMMLYFNAHGLDPNWAQPGADQV